MEIPLGYERFLELAGWLTGLLTTHGAKAAEDLAETATANAKGRIIAKSKEVWAWLKDRFNKDDTASGIMDDLEANPDDEEAQKELANALASKMKRDPDFLEALRPHLKELKDLESQVQVAGRDVHKQDMSKTGRDSINVQADGEGHNININR